MKAATSDWEDSRPHELGVALAAIQIDQPLKIVIVRNDFENKSDKSYSVFINPEIVKLEGEVEEAPKVARDLEREDCQGDEEGRANRGVAIDDDLARIKVDIRDIIESAPAARDDAARRGG